MSSNCSAPSSLFSSRTLLILLLSTVVAALIVCWRLGFSAHSGQAGLLVAMALAASFLLAQFVRQRFKLSMRTLLAAMTILGVLFGLIGARLMESRRHRQAVARIEQLGGGVRYSTKFQDDGSGCDWYPE